MYKSIVAAMKPSDISQLVYVPCISKLSTDNLSVSVGKTIVTNCPPAVFIENFNSSFPSMISSNKSYTYFCDLHCF